MIQELFTHWCKQTKRSGGVLTGSSIKEWHTFLEQMLKIRNSADNWKDFQRFTKEEIKEKFGLETYGQMCIEAEQIGFPSYGVIDPKVSKPLVAFHNSIVEKYSNPNP